MARGRWWTAADSFPFPQRVLVTDNDLLHLGAPRWQVSPRLWLLACLPPSYLACLLTAPLSSLPPATQALTYHLATEKTPGSLEYDAAWANGERVEQLAREQGKPLPQMRKPWGVAVGVKGSNVLVSDNELHCIHVFNEVRCISLRHRFHGSCMPCPHIPCR